MRGSAHRPRVRANSSREVAASRPTLDYTVTGGFFEGRDQRDLVAEAIEWCIVRHRIGSMTPNKAMKGPPTCHFFSEKSPGGSAA